MRLWSIDPKILDRAGLGAAWREGLLAQSVIHKLQTGQKPGYRNHPQLKRFLAADDPLASIGTWLSGIQTQADQRGYNYNRNLIIQAGNCRLTVTTGQLEFEFDHIMAKLKKRSPSEYWFHFGYHIDREDFSPHQMFDVIPGPIEDWEKG